MMRPRRAIAAAALAFSALVAPAGAGAQEIPKPEYITYLPREIPRAVSRTNANARFEIYGRVADAGYRDVSPRDGIDDRRNAWYLALSQRFAPWLARNAYGFPMDARRFMRDGAPFPLVVDEFEMSRTRPILVRSDSIDVSRLADAPCDGTSPPGSPDCRLRDLLREHGPQTAEAVGPAGADSDRVHVMYFNYPGDSPKTWAQEYGGGNNDGVAPRYIGWAKSYVHPFVADAAEPAGDARFEFVLQYWFYYPTNDAGNVHEGDWEHLNVVIAPRATVTRPLAPAEVERIAAGDLPIDDLVIRRVEYYFHHWVYPIDWTRPNVYAPRAQWQAEMDTLPEARRGENRLRRRIREQAYEDEDETRLNLHPFVYIGGDGRGLNVLLSAPTKLGRSSHGSYPFPGLYKSVGPAGTGEAIVKPGDVFDDPPAADAPESERVVRYDNPARLEVLPDWERLADLALEEPGVRRDWAWLLVPARLGYPATVSPFAGVVRYAETGNTSILPPIYSGGWNRLGDGAGYAFYVPHRVSSVFPGDVQDTFHPNWGYLNLTAPTIALLPPFDALSRALGAPIRLATNREQPSFYRSEDLPFRSIGAGGGVTTFDPGDMFWRLLGFQELATPFLQKVIARTGSINGVGLLPVEQEQMNGWRGELNLHLGKRFASTNGLFHGVTRLTVPLLYTDGSGSDEFTANLNLWEYTGSLRYNLAGGSFEPFLIGGYGISWYRLENATAFGEILGDGNCRWVHKPGFFENLLPNTFHIGAGLELLPTHRIGKVDLGLKGSASFHTHSLGLETGDATTVFFQNGQVKRWVFDALLTLSY